MTMAKKCLCIYEPRGDYGLEGFERETIYDFTENQTKEGKTFYRVFPNAESEYYEVCGPRVFQKHFQEVKIGKS